MFWSSYKIPTLEEIVGSGKKTLILGPKNCNNDVLYFNTIFKNPKALFVTNKGYYHTYKSIFRHTEFSSDADDIFRKGKEYDAVILHNPDMYRGYSKTLTNLLKDENKTVILYLSYPTIMNPKTVDMFDYVIVHPGFSKSIIKRIDVVYNNTDKLVLDFGSDRIKLIDRKPKVVSELDINEKSYSTYCSIL